MKKWNSRLKFTKQNFAIYLFNFQSKFVKILSCLHQVPSIKFYHKFWLKPIWYSSHFHSVTKVLYNNIFPYTIFNCFVKSFRHFSWDRHTKYALVDGSRAGHEVAEAVEVNKERLGQDSHSFLIPWRNELANRQGWRERPLSVIVAFN